MWVACWVARGAPMAAETVAAWAMAATAVVVRARVAWVRGAAAAEARVTAVATAEGTMEAE